MIQTSKIIFCLNNSIQHFSVARMINVALCAFQYFQCSCYFENKTYSTGADRWLERNKSFATGGLQLSKFVLFPP